MNDNASSFFSLVGRVAIVTGAARGNGRAIAEGLLCSGATVYFLDVSVKELEALKNQIQNRSARFIKADVTNTKLMQAVIKKIFNKEKRIDILFNNAGITLSAPSERYSSKQWEDTHRVNLKAPFMLSQMVAHYMKKKRKGVIINITSLGSELGFPNNPAYVAFKGGLKQLTKALARDWGQYNIRVNNLGLGYFKTKMTQKSWEDRSARKLRTQRTLLGRWGESKDLVGPAIFLASDASRYMTGQDLYIDGGWLANGI